MSRNVRESILVFLLVVAVGSIFGILVNYSNDVISLRQSSSMSEKTVLRLMQKIVEKKSHRVKVTGYHPDSGGINSDSNPSMTSTMTPHKAGRTCAISTELVEAGWLGKEIYIEGYGMVVANDRLAKSIEGKQIDLCKGSLKDALAVGVNYDVLSTLVDRKYINEIIGE